MKFLNYSLSDRTRPRFPVPIADQNLSKESSVPQTTTWAELRAKAPAFLPRPVIAAAGHAQPTLCRDLTDKPYDPEGAFLYRTS